MIGVVLKKIMPQIALRSLNGYTAAFFWLCISYPGRLSADSLMVLGDVKARDWNQHHTVVYEVIVFIFTIGGNFPWVMFVSQLLLVAFAVNQFLGSFFAELRSNYRRILSFFLVMVPFFGGFASTLWKDSLSMIFLILSFSFFRKSAVSKSKFYLIVGGLLLTLFLCLRYENIPIIIILGAVLLIKAKFKRTEIFAMILLTTTSSMFITNTLNSILSAREVDNSLRYVVPLHDLTNLSLLHKEDLELRAYTNKFSTGSSLEGASFCPNVNPFLYTKDYKAQLVTELSPQPIEKWIEYSLKYPLDVLRNHKCRSAAFLPFPISFGPKYTYFIHPGIDENSFKFEFEPLFANLNNALLQIINLLGGVFLWPGMIITLHYLVVALHRRQIDSEDILLQSAIFYPIINSLVLFVIAPGQDFRYMASATSLALLIVGGITLTKIQRIQDINSKKN